MRSAISARAYGMEFISPEGVSTDAEPSARDMARIIAQIRKQKIPAVFMENITDPRLMQQIAKETGAKIGGTLYSDALSDAGRSGGDLHRHDAQQRPRAEQGAGAVGPSASVLHHAERGEQPPLVLDILVRFVAKPALSAK